MRVQCVGLIAAIGVALQLLGAGLALAGVGLAFRRMEQTPASVEKARATTRALRRAALSLWGRLLGLSRRLIGWPRGRPPEFRAEGAVDVAEGADTAVVSGEHRPKRLDRQVDKLRDDLRELKREVKQQASELDDKMKAEREARERGDDEARAFAAKLLAGALELEIYAAAAILVGVALANVGPLLC